MVIVAEHKAIYARQTWTHAMNRIQDTQEEIRVLHAETRAFEARAPKHPDGLEDAGNFSGAEGAVGLTRWFEKPESVFRVSKVEDSDNVKYAMCTMLDGALTGQ
ncbi:hypothetical protein Tco_0926729 [Tanacetum coccineum]|uniref:Uncharacterized protein n=1 Tax=Tanacetum coccineum TaxID=301880 RepID=A0ABQ5DBM7_9ASTR